MPAETLTGFVFVVGLTSMVRVGLTGAAGAATFLALWVLLGTAYGRASASCLLRGPRLVWLMPCLAVLSILWSQAPPETLRFSVEYVCTVACSVLTAWLLKPRTLLLALTCSLILLSVISIAVGRETVDPLTGMTTLIGVFDSKNQLGFFASLMFLAAVALVVDSSQSGLVRLLGSGAALLSLPLMVVTRSATSLASVALATVVLISGLLASRLDRFGRSRVLAGAITLLILGSVVMIAAGANAGGEILQLLGKNDTLTGRTYLWRYAAQLIPDDPLLGRGYQAFWRQDDVNAESIWSFFHILSRGGFSFHNAFVEQTIELGFVGAAILAATLVGVAIGALRWSWQARSVPAAFFVALTVCMLARSMAEVDFLGPFQLGTFIMAVTATYAATKPCDNES